jgi:RND family efflux transporter MFP subunit
VVSTPAYVGVVIAPQAVELAAEVSGTLVEQVVPLGEPVEAGAALATVRPPTLLEEIDGAAAALAQVEAAQAEQALIVAAATRTLAQEQQLASAGVTTGDARAKAQLELDGARVVARRLGAQRAERQAELRRLHAQRSLGRVTAPFSGTVATWYCAEGAVVSRGERLVRLVAADRLWVRFAIPVEDLPHVRPGVEVDVVPVPEVPARRAVVRRVAPELDLASQRILVEAELHEASGLTAGQACHVTRSADAASKPAIGVVSSAAPATAPLGGAPDATR